MKTVPKVRQQIAHDSTEESKNQSSLISSSFLGYPEKDSRAQKNVVINSSA